MSEPLVVGFGVTGRALARHLADQGRRPVVVDDHPAPDADVDAARLGVTLEVAPDRERLKALVAAAGMVVPSPGVPISHPVFAMAEANGVAVVAEIELGWETLAARGDHRPRLVAITGTNGKTTVTTDVAAMLSASGMRVATAGNIGTPLVAVAGSDLLAVIVAEVSSFQLAATRRWHPDVSCWLNFSADHLDWHPTLDDYAEAKAAVWANQGAGDTVVVNADDAAVMARAAAANLTARVVTFSTQGAADYHLEGETLVEAPGVVLAQTSDLVRNLPHDRANALAALAVARAAGASEDGCRRGLQAATILPHRVQLVAENAGVRWYDDSKATTPASVLAAVAGFGSVVLIAGGRNKGLDLSALLDAVPPVRAVVAIGEAAEELAAVFGEVIPLSVATSMTSAVALAARYAQPGDAVVLSPGCASFDWYRSYAQRGDDFAAVVHQLTSRGVPSC